MDYQIKEAQRRASHTSQGGASERMDYQSDARRRASHASKDKASERMDFQSDEVQPQEPHEHSAIPQTDMVCEELSKSLERWS